MQESIADQIARDTRSIPDWAHSMGRLPARLYPHDPVLSRAFEAFLRDVVSSASNLDCIGTDDPVAPPVGSPTCAVLAYLFRRWPDQGAEFRKLISQADQLLGRHELLQIVTATNIDSLGP